MPYVYPEVDDLDGHDLVGTHQCAALVQAFAGAPRTSDWRQGVSGQGRELDRCEQQWRCLLGDRMTTNRLLAALLAAAIALGAPRISAAAETVTCPPLFPGGSVHFTPTDDGWTAEPGHLAPYLVGWGLYSGPPAELAELQESDSGNGWESWKLDGAYPEGLWVQCVYAGGGLTLTRKLSTVTGTCTARHEKTPPTKPKPVSFVCR